jgi:hypothetical protein
LKSEGLDVQFILLDVDDEKLTRKRKKPSIRNSESWMC